MMARPARDEAAEYYFRYIDQVGEGDLFARLAAQPGELAAMCGGLSAAESVVRPAPDAWSPRDLVGHLADTERLFMARAFWFARGFDTALPSFDQHVAVAAARADDRDLTDLVDDFTAARAATLAFFRGLPLDAWDRRGIASGHEFSVRALAFLAAGHVEHHLRLLGERYPSMAAARPR